MAWIIFDLIANCFQGFLICNFSLKCFCSKTHPVFFNFILWLLCTLFFSSLYLTVDSPPIDMLVFLFPLIFSTIFSRDYFLTILYWHLILALVFALISGLANHIVLLLPLSLRMIFESHGWVYLLYLLITNILLFLSVHIIIKQKTHGSALSFSSYLNFFLMIASIFLTEESLYYSSGNLVQQAGENALIILLANLGLLSCTFLSVSLFQTVSLSALRESRYQAEHTLLLQEKQHQEELEQTYSKLVKIRHDLKHHFQVIEQFIDSNKKQEAAEYLDSIKSTYCKGNFMTGCSALDALLDVKFSKMKKNNIEFKYSTSCSLYEPPIETADFCSVIGNLLDNAIEGIQRLPESKRNHSTIHLSFFKVHNMFYVNCENPCSSSALILKHGRYLSSKSDSSNIGIHGIGLRSIENIAEQAEGRCSFYCKNGVFYSQIVFPIKTYALE